MYKSLLTAHPLSLFTYFCLNLILIMIQRNPVVIILQSISLIFITRNFNKYYFLMIIIISLSNPLFVHRGEHILFMIMDISITLESLIYGFVFSLLIMNTLLLFSLMNKVWNSEHYIYLFGNHFPHIALLISMTSQMIPRFMKQYQVINTCQKQFYKGNKIKQLLNTFSIEVSWAFESSIDMLDSMSARGYGVNKRTHYHLFHFSYKDTVYISMVLILFMIGSIGYFFRFKNFYYYPMIILEPFQFIDYFYIVSFVLIILLPLIWEVEYVRSI